MAYHCLTKYKDGGTCRSMTGEIFWYFVYVEDPKSRWGQKDRTKQEKICEDVIRYLIREGKKEKTFLRMFMKSCTLRLPYEIQQNNIKTWTGDFAGLSGFPSMKDMDMDMKTQYPKGQNFYIFLANKAGRAYATPSVEAGTVDSEFCVVYRSDFNALLHEVLHVFGAADFYYPKQVSEAASKIFEKSVMLNASDSVIDDLTRYLIGWHKAPSEKARQLLEATAGITQEMVSQALKEEQIDKNGFGRMKYSNGVIYEGNFVNGIAEGKGTLYYTNGAVYKGEIRQGNPHGRGKITYADGSVQEGYFKEGKYQGKRP